MLKYKLSQIDIISKKIIKKIQDNDCLFLTGEIGTGKTTFTRSLINQLQKKNKVKKTDVLSPTFNILYEYKIRKLKIMHYDLYRIKKSLEVKELGIFNDLEKSIKIIEWPKIINLNVRDRLEISFYYSGKKENERKIKVQGFGEWKGFKINDI
tara:strand:- start:243 stop:701 length:459 start_codon:yes stop_codon:yes gene_type:complete